MIIVVPCDSGGPLYNGYVCSCVDSNWSCQDKYPDLALCVAHPADAGVDATGADVGSEAAADAPAE